MDWQSIQPIFHWLSDHPVWSSIFVFVIALSESLIVVGLIVPGTVLMFGVGTLVGAGVLDVKLVLFLAFVGAVLGDGISFWIGAKYRHQLENCWPFKNNPQILEKGKTYFIKHGGKSIFFGRFVGPIRPIIPAVAGMMYMPAKKFFVINVCSAAGWAPVYLIPGILFGTSIELATVIGFRVAAILLVSTIFIITFVFLLKKLTLPALRAFVISLCFIFVVSGGWIYVTLNKQHDNRQISFNRWIESSWQLFPEKRIDFFGNKKETFNLQWLGEISTIKQSLLRAGWQTSDELTFKSVLYRLAAEIKLHEAIRFPQFHLNNAESVLLIKSHVKKNHQWVLQLWRSNMMADDQESYWVGVVSLQKLVTDNGWVSYFKQDTTLNDNKLNFLVGNESWDVKLKKRPNNQSVALIHGKMQK